MVSAPITCAIASPLTVSANSGARGHAAGVRRWGVGRCGARRYAKAEHAQTLLDISPNAGLPLFDALCWTGRTSLGWCSPFSGWRMVTRRCNEEQIEEFREFLDQVRPEDFARGPD